MYHYGRYHCVSENLVDSMKSLFCDTGWASIWGDFFSLHADFPELIQHVPF